MKNSIFRDSCFFFRFLISLLRPKAWYPNVLVLNRTLRRGGGLKAKILSKKSFKKYAPNILYLISSDLPFFVKFFIYFCKLCKIKIVLNQNGVYFPAWFNGNVLNKNENIKKIIEKSDFVIFQSIFAKKMVEKYVMPRVKIKSRIIYNSHNINSRCKSYKKKSVLNICVAGSHNFEERITKGYDICKKLACKQKVRFNIFGYIHKRILKKVKTQICSPQKNLEVFVHGEYNDEDIVKILKSQDFLVHAQPLDCCPKLLVDAMACGVPFLAQNNGGVPELAGKQLKKYLISTASTSTKYDWGDTNEYIKKLKMIQNDKNIQAKLINRSKKFGKKYFENAHDTIFRSIIN